VVSRELCHLKETNKYNTLMAVKKKIKKQSINKKKIIRSLFPRRSLLARSTWSKFGVQKLAGIATKRRNKHTETFINYAKAVIEEQVYIKYTKCGYFGDFLTDITPLNFDGEVPQEAHKVTYSQKSIGACVLTK